MNYSMLTGYVIGMLTCAMYGALAEEVIPPVPAPTQGYTFDHPNCRLFAPNSKCRISRNLGR